MIRGPVSGHIPPDDICFAFRTLFSIPPYGQIGADRFRRSYLQRAMGRLATADIGFVKGERDAKFVNRRAGIRWEEC